MIRRPPRSTPFPTRRSSDLPPHALHARQREQCGPFRRGPGRRRSRSEEHTSELQSQSNLVCRLLLEKKKQMPLDVNGVAFIIAVTTLRPRTATSETPDTAIH